MENSDVNSLKNEYDNIIKPLSNLEYYDLVKELYKKLPELWTIKYENFSNRTANSTYISFGNFEYLFDDYQNSEPDNLNTTKEEPEPRLIVAYGISTPQKTKRDDYRLRGWIGNTEQFFGNSWDKGHFIAHSIGGAVDGIELNVFPQLRATNRGWSESGKLFRKMENYCFENKGVFCFNRPIYSDQSFRPKMLEFGILMMTGNFWVETFKNF